MSEPTTELRHVKREDDNMHTYTTVVYDTVAPEYYLIPELKLLIPVCGSSASLLLEATLLDGDMTHSANLVDYPVVNHRHATMHFPTYKVLAVMRKIKICKPLKTFSGWDEGIRKRKYEVDLDNQRFETEKARARTRSTPDISHLRNARLAKMQDASTQQEAS